jgi:hypothetical protein
MEPDNFLTISFACGRIAKSAYALRVNTYRQNATWLHLSLLRFMLRATESRLVGL